MAQSDLEEIDQLWKVGDWVYGLRNLRFYTDQECCPNKGFVATYNGKIVGTGLAYHLNSDYGALGAFYVHPQYRNQNIGQLIWEARMQFMADRNVMVMSMARRAGKNMKLGFDKIYYEGNFYLGFPDRNALKDQTFENHVDHIEKICDVDIDEMVKYDSTIHPIISRKQYLETAIHNYSMRGFVAFKDGSIVGYVGENPSDEFAMIGPWYAENKFVAKCLLKEYFEDVPETLPHRILTPKPNTDCIDILSEVGIPLVAEWKCLFNKEIVQVPLQKIYAPCNHMTWLC